MSVWREEMVAELQSFVVNVVESSLAVTKQMRARRLVELGKACILNCIHSEVRGELMGAAEGVGEM